MVSILTGAGFSSNVGAPLASGVSEQVFTILAGQGHEDAARLVRENGFEKACLGLARIDPDLMRIREAVVAVFHGIDDLHRQLMPTHAPNDHWQAVIKQMMNLLSLVRNGGWIFTINYDLIVERFLKVDQQVKLHVGRPHYQDSTWFQNFSWPKSRTENTARLHMDQSANGVAYVKLHGSIDLYDGGQYPIVGVVKKEDIESHSVLSRYWRSFEEKLCTPNARLLVIGYGFADDHINEVLLKGVQDGLKLFVWDVVPLATTLQKLDAIDARLAASLEGYCGQSIRERFPSPLPDYWLTMCPDIKAFVEGH